MDVAIADLPGWLSFLLGFKYLFLFLATILEGMNSIVLAGFLTSIGQLKVILIIPMLIVAHAINGYLWYGVGYWGGAGVLDWWRKRSRVSNKAVNRVENYFKRYSGRAILFAKFTLSLEIITMILSGVLRYPLNKFFRYNLIGSAGWVALAFSFGFLFGESLAISISLVENSIFILLFLLGAIALLYLVKFIIKRLFLRYIGLQDYIKELGEKLRDGIDDMLGNIEK